MHVVLVDFRIKADKADAFAQAILANARQSLADEPACRLFDVCRDPADPCQFFLYELYDDEAAFAAHLQTPHFLQMNASTAAWVEAKSVRQLRLLLS
jgi:(4S)-4-hydroxy-5-phosphonooxypentane-2,3-dione isomerase